MRHAACGIRHVTAEVRQNVADADVVADYHDVDDDHDYGAHMCILGVGVCVLVSYECSLHIRDVY